VTAKLEPHFEKELDSLTLRSTASERFLTIDASFSSYHGPPNSRGMLIDPEIASPHPIDRETNANGIR
jgi:hypothetical protein